MTDNELFLEDRINKIKQVVSKYGEDNFYMSFSGGKDSTALSALVDLALPENKIPRVYANTGIEYRLILEFVEREREREHPWELIMLKPSIPIKPTLDKEGYPFKSKAHSRWVDMFQRNGRTQSIENYTQSEKADKSIYRPCPKKLQYQFSDSFKLRISDKCCLRMKEEPIDKWAKANNKKYGITGIMREEGGRRSISQCLAFRGNKLSYFQPLVPATKEWKTWFINKYNVAISDIYKEPYNLPRTGCKGCPFALHLQDELDTLEKFFPNERKQCEIVWKPVYEEYRRIGYRLKPLETEYQMTLDEWLNIKL